MGTTQRRLLLGLFVLLGAGLIFVLPWFGPQWTPTVSDSYTFGFSNMTADIGVALLLWAVLVWRLRDEESAGQQEAVFDLLAAKPRAGSAWLSRLATLLAVALVVGVAGGWWLYLPKAYFGESTYFLARLDRMLMGQKPFRDFDFGYGPWMLQAPFYLHRLCGGRLAIDTSYILCLLVCFALGVLALAYVVRALGIPEWLKALLILGFAVVCANITLGIIYTPLRYIFPLWAVITHQRRIRADIDEGSGISLSQAVLAFALPLIGFGICPDTGLVTFLGILVGCLWFARTLWSLPMLGALAAAASLGVVVVLYGLDYFRLLLVFGGGAYNFPIFPAPYILVFLACVFYLLPDIGVIALDEEGAEAPLFAAVLVVLGLFIPGALGRCDPGHVFGSGLGLFLLAAASLATSRHRWRRVACVCGALLLYGTLMAGFWYDNKPALRYVVGLRRQLAAHRADFQPVAAIPRAPVAPGAQPFDWGKQTPISKWMTDGLRGTDPLGLPLGAGEDVDRFLKATGRYIPEYSVAPFGGTFTVESMRRKLADLDAMDAILVPRIYFRHLQAFDADTYAREASARMQGLFLFPVHLSVVNDPLDPDAILIRRIARDFLPVTKFENYELLRRKNVFEQ